MTFSIPAPVGPRFLKRKFEAYYLWWISLQKPASSYGNLDFTDGVMWITSVLIQLRCTILCVLEKVKRNILFEPISAG
jgi:hypothetical protein